MDYFLHIGTHKTGSTALQSFLFANKEQLLKLGILYPTFGLEDKAHHLVANTLKAGDIEKTQRLFSDIEQEATKLGVNKILLSSECFEFIRNDNVLKSFLPKLPKLKVIVFIRRPDYFLESEYNQHIRMYNLRYQHDIYRFYYKYNFVARFNYQLLCQRWGIFSALNVINYDHCLTQTHGIFKALLASIDVAWDDNFSIPPDNECNISLSNIGTIYLARMNRLDLSATTHQTAIRIIAQQFASTPKRQLLSYEDRWVLWRRVKDTNEIVVKKYAVAPFIPPHKADNLNLPAIDFCEDFNNELFEQLLTQVKV